MNRISTKFGMFRLLAPLFVFGLVLGFVCTTPANADELYASIRGNVTDQSGALIPEARITATNVDTGVSKAVTTSKDGAFAFLQLAVGDYSVKIEKAGFKTFAEPGIRLVVNQVYILNAKLELGTVAETITVEANAAQVETSTPQRGDVVDSNQILSLPLVGRNWVNLQQLEGGVVAASDARGEYATNGSQTTQNSFLINGTDSNDLPLNTRSIIPSEDAIQEFQMATNNINPEFGRNSGAVVNALIKSGTNNFHGDVFDFYRDTFLNARDYFTKAPAVFHQHQFGATVGGPIWKNHSFFFFSYQGRRFREPDAGVASSTPVYTSDQLNGGTGAFTNWANGTLTVNSSGVVTAVTNPNLSPIPLTGDSASPCAGTPCPAGTPYGIAYNAEPTGGCIGSLATSPACAPITSGLFSTGTVPTANINSLASSLISKYVPPPNVAGSDVYAFSPLTTGSDNQYIFRIDQNLGKKDLVWGSWLQESNPTTDTIPFVGATLPGFGEIAERHFKLLTLSWSHTINDHMINELRGGYDRFNFVAVEPLTVTQPSSAGFNNITPQDPAGAGLPVIDIAGLFDLGFSQDGPQPRKDQTYQVTDNFSFTHGHHTMKAGFDMRRFEVDNPFYAENNGFYNYAGAGTYSTRNAGADFLLGFPDFYLQESGGYGSDRGQEYYSYFQDQWKIRPNFTFTYGLGWTIDTPLVDNSYGGHGMAAFYPGQQSTVFPNAPLGVVYSGDAGVHAAGTTHTWRNWGPRIGFAYSPDWGTLTGGPGKTSIRGGFGMYYNRTEEELNLQFQGVPPNSISTGGAAAASETVSCTFGPLNPSCPTSGPNADQETVVGSPSFVNPYVDVAGVVPTVSNPFPFVGATSNVQFLSTNGNLPVWSACCAALDQNNVDPTSYNYSLTIERQLTNSMILSVAYVGSEGHHLEIGHPKNLVTNLAPCLADTTCNAGDQLSKYPGDFLYPGTNPKINQYGSIDTISNMGNSNYNSMQVGLKKNLSRGLQFTANYTWSHAMDNGSGFENSSFGGFGFGSLAASRAYNPYLPASNIGPSAYDARQRLVVGYTYQIPGMHGSGLVPRATTGWIISGITTFQKGFPMDVVDSSDPSLHCYPGNSDFACMDVPNVVAPIQYTSWKTNPITGNQFFSPSSFASAPEGTFGNAPRNLLQGPGINNWDFQLSKDTKITESTRMELRIEFYNLFNRTQILSPAAIITDINFGPAFGQVFSDNGVPREIQLAAKFYF